MIKYFFQKLYLAHEMIKYLPGSNTQLKQFKKIVPWTITGYNKILQE